MSPAQLIARRPWLSLTCLLAFVAFVALAAAIAAGYDWPGDRPLLLTWQSRPESPLRWLMVAVSYIGFLLPFVPLIAVIGLALWQRRGRAEALFVIVPTSIAYALSWVVKALVRRPRPVGEEIDIYVQLDRYGFPSQHVLSYTVFFGLLFFLAWSRWRGEAVRWPTMVVCGLLVALVGPSRVYLGAHWPTDVLGGYLMGYAIWAMAVLSEPLSLGEVSDGRAK